MEDLKRKEILLGTYEAFILGYKLSEDGKSLVSKNVMLDTFSFKSHARMSFSFGTHKLGEYWNLNLNNLLEKVYRSRLSLTTLTAEVFVLLLLQTNSWLQVEKMKMLRYRPFFQLALNNELKIFFRRFLIYVVGPSMEVWRMLIQQ